MKSIISFLGIMMCAWIGAIAQDHIPVPHTIPHGTSRICWGYAMGRAGRKPDGDATCNPVTLIPSENAISTAYFRELLWSEKKDSLQYGDILYWPGTHAMYVTSTPTKDAQGHIIESSIYVDHTAASWDDVYTDDAFSTAKQRLSLGNPYSFYRRKDVQVFGHNKFYDGSGSTISAGTISIGNVSGPSPKNPWLDWSQSWTATATNEQEYPLNSGRRRFSLTGIMRVRLIAIFKYLSKSELTQERM